MLCRDSSEPEDYGCPSDPEPDKRLYGEGWDAVALVLAFWLHLFRCQRNLDARRSRFHSILADFWPFLVNLSFLCTRHCAEALPPQRLASCLLTIVSCHTGEGRYLLPQWVPTFVGMAMRVMSRTSLMLPVHCAQFR